MKNSVVFLYSGGREKRAAEALRGEVPSEFFYGAIEFPADSWDVRFIDFRDHPESWVAAVGNRLMSFSLPVRVRVEHLIGALGLLGQLKEASVVVATSSYLALALGWLQKLGFRVPPIVAIHCGLANHPPDGLKLRLTRAILRRQKCVFFSPGEAAETASQFGLPPAAMVSNPFGVDTTFWCPAARPAPGEYLLAVGNDARRDYDVLLQAAVEWRMPVRIVTARKLRMPLPANVEWLEGNWHRPAVTDHELRDLYRGARAVVVPLVDSPQPSGQSVALQAMACGRAVVMTRTRGLWTGEDFRDGEHLKLVAAGDSRALGESVRSLIESPDLALKLGNQALGQVKQHGNIQSFATLLERLCT